MSFSEAMKLSGRRKNMGKYEDWRIWTFRTGGGKKTEKKIMAITFPFLAQFGPNLKYSSFVTSRFE